ncbi:MAG: TonB-dependent receptor plug domain-containing protein, partial [Bacteroidota bacterium]
MVSTVFFLWIGITNAQNTESFNLENQPLRTALDQLEDKFKVNFSFSNDVIADILVDLKGDLNLQKALRLLQVQSALSFEMVRENNFLVYKSKDDGHENEGELDLITLENTIIKAYLTQGMDRNLNGSITVAPDKLSSLPGLIEPDVLQTVQLLPGINSSLETAADIQIRGGTPDQNLVLWDGIKMYHTGHYFGMFSAFNPFITDQIDVYRSATLSKYGDRVSGIIDIQSKDIVLEDFNGGIGINMTHADAYIQLPIIENKLSILVAARRSYMDLFSTYTSDRYFNRVFQSTRISSNSNLIIENEQLNELQNDVSFLDSNLKIQWRPSDKDEISLSALYLKNDLDYKIEDII